MQPAVFLDRDNTLIVNEGDLGDPALVRLHEGVPAGLRSLRAAGYRLIVVTNQGGVARGAYTESDVDAVHQRIAELVDERARETGLIDRFYYCPYHPEGKLAEYQRDHPWRKPNPGMLLQAARDMQLDLTRSWLVGDQRRDIVAGQSAGCHTILICGNAPPPNDLRPTALAGSFSEAVQFILNQSASSTAGENRASTNGANPAPRPRSARDGDDAITRLRQAMSELADELRLHRAARTEFTLVKMGAVMCQLLVLLLGLLGLLQLAHAETFMIWMLGAIVMQLFTIALLLLDGADVTGDSVSAVRLRALEGRPLEDEAIRAMVIAAAEALAEREGLLLINVHAEPASITLTLETDRIVSIAFASELRRLTTAWYTAKYQEPTLWGEIDAREGERWKDA